MLMCLEPHVCVEPLVPPWHPYQLTHASFSSQWSDLKLPCSYQESSGRRQPWRDNPLYGKGSFTQWKRSSGVQVHTCSTKQSIWGRKFRLKNLPPCILRRSSQAVKIQVPSFFLSSLLIPCINSVPGIFNVWNKQLVVRSNKKKQPSGFKRGSVTQLTRKRVDG